MHLLPLLTEALALAGTVEQLLGAAAVSRFVRRPADRAPTRGPRELPPITVLKPLAGDEPLLEQALASFFTQRYPAFQLVFGVHSASDPAVAVVKRLQRRFPVVDATLVIDPRRAGPNHKVGNLLNMEAWANHEILVISDSDIHAPPDLLAGIAAGLAKPDVGLVSSLYTGRPGVSSIAANLGAAQISHGFLPSVLLARAMGREDCLGAVMALHRADLAAIGGLEALLPHLADDAVLGQKIRALGKHLDLSPQVVATTVPESSLGALWTHELRWARTIRAQAPLSYAASILQYPLAFALINLAISQVSLWSVGLFVSLWLMRALANHAIDRHLKIPDRYDLILLPLRDLLSAAEVIAAYFGNRVNWRGESLSTQSHLMSHQG